MSTTGRIALSLIVSATSLATGGCLAVAAAGAAAAGTHAYANGALQGREEASVEHLHGAARAAVDQLGFRVKEDAVDASSARIVAEEADGTDIKINIEPESDRLSRVSVRVGVFGEKSASRMIYDKIKANL